MLATDSFWSNIVRYLNEQKLTPVISNQVVNKAFLRSEDVARWAHEIEYPLSDTDDNLTRVAQFLSVTKRDPAGAKRDYLEFLSKRWLGLARAEQGADQEHLDRTERELSKLKFSELATQWLKLPDFEKDQDHPLRILANLDIPIYLTTSHHGFLEAALHAAGKHQFRSEVYCWCRDVKPEVPVECQPDGNFVPSVEQPLIYHLHGLDAYPDSIVLTEDDYLRFMASVVLEFGSTQFTPRSVIEAVSNSFLLLLGYELHAWDLSVLLHGILKRVKRHKRGFAIQIDPRGMDSITDLDKFKQYLERYFDEAAVDVCLGKPRDFMTTLRDKWQGPSR